MKKLLNGVAIAAVLAIATPVFAQAQNAPMSPSAQKPAASAPAAGMPGPAAAKAPRQRHRAMRSSMRRMHRPKMMRAHGRRGMMMGSGDNMTDQLNKQELARIQGGGMMPHGQMMGGPPMGQPPMGQPMMGQPMMSPMQQGPRPSGH